MKRETFDNLEVILEEESVHSPTSDTDTTTGGVGVNLTATIMDENKQPHKIYGGLVRGIGRHDDDFWHWYKTIDDIEEKEGEVHVTLSSSLLKDTYAFDKEDKTVRLVDSVNLEELRKQENMRGIIEGLQNQPLQDVVDQFGKYVAEKYKQPQTKPPQILGKEIDEEQNLGVVAVGIYQSGYDPAMNQVQLYSVKPDGAFQRLESIDVGGYGRPKFSETYLKIGNMEIEEEKLHIEGAVRQQYWSGMGFAARPVENVDEERTIGNEYHNLDEMEYE